MSYALIETFLGFCRCNVYGFSPKQYYVPATNNINVIAINPIFTKCVSAQRIFNELLISVVRWTELRIHLLGRKVYSIRSNWHLRNRRSITNRGIIIHWSCIGLQGTIYTALLNWKDVPIPFCKLHRLRTNLNLIRHVNNVRHLLLLSFI